MIVQATIEDGPNGLLECLNEARRTYSQKIFRGTILADPEFTGALQELTPADFHRFHDAGVRSIRIHGSYGGSGDNWEWVCDRLRSAAGLYPVKKLGWSLSAQLPLAMWSAIAETLLHDEELAGIPIVAEHNGCASPNDIGSPELEALLRLLEVGRLYVKVGALHRRTSGDIKNMRAVVKQFAEKGPDTIVWGSDWPHIDGSQKGLVPSPPLQGVDDSGELLAIRSWLSDQQWYNMLVSNPARLFA